MNLEQAKEHFKTAYMVHDAARTYNHGESVIEHDSFKETSTVILCKSNKGVVILYDKEFKKTAPITKEKSTREAMGERAINLIKDIVESADYNSMLMESIIGRGILSEAEKIHAVCQ